MQGTQTLLSPSNNKNNTLGLKARLATQFTVLGLLLSQPFFLSYSYAAPVGGNVVGGTGTISRQDIHTTINQSSQKLAIDWQSFDVQQNEHVHFIQPDASSIALNRIVGNNGSVIQGQIDANGQVILVNPNGVFFTSTATVNVGGLVASSLDMTPSDFMNGNYIFNEVIGADGAVVNSGLINASTGGNVALIGKQVKNDGLIAANLGSVVLAAGKQSVLTFDNQGLIGVKVTKEVLQNEVGVEEAVINNGEIKAAGGRVLLTASTSQDVFSQAVNSGSLNQATSVVVNDDGSFTLGGGADVLNTGSIDVSSVSNSQNTARIVLLGENINSSGEIKADVSSGQAGEIEIHAKDKTLLTANSLTSAQASSSGQGGLIKVLGDKVGLFDTAQVNASGANGGGEVLMGGDRQGLNSAIRNASFTYLGENTRVFADGLGTGNGGKLITFASDTARIYGNLYARGGANAGDGGFIETSGLRGFEILKTPNISAFDGNGGTWLIDPYNITIVNSSDCGTTYTCTSGLSDPFTPAANDTYLDVALVEDAFSNSNTTVEINTGSEGDGGQQAGDLTFKANFNVDRATNRDYTLNLKAKGSIIFDTGSSITATSTNDTLSINLTADMFGNGAGDIIFKGTTIDTFGGDFKIINAVNITSTGTNSNTLSTAGGDFIVDDAVGFNVPNLTINTDAGNVDLDGNGNGVTGDIILGNITTTNFTATAATSIGQSATSVLDINGLADLAATATNSIDLQNTGNDFNQVNFRNAVNVALTDGAGGISIAANDGADSGGITGDLTLTAIGGDITDYDEVNLGANLISQSPITVDNGFSIYLDSSKNTFNGDVWFLASSGRINNLTITDDTELRLPDINIDGSLFVTGDSIVFGNTSVSTSANNTTVLNAITTSTSGAGTITQAANTSITVGTATDTSLTATATSNSIVLQNAGNNFASVYIDGVEARITDVDAIDLADQTTVTGILEIIAGGDITDSGSIIVSNATNNAQTIFDTTGSITINGANGNFNQVNFRNAVNVTLTDTTGGIDIAANSSPGSGGITGNLTLRAIGGDITDYAEVNSGSSYTDTASFTVDNGYSIYLDSSKNTFNGKMSFLASSGRINNLTITDDTELRLPDINIDGSLIVTGDSIVFGNTAVSTSANNTTVLNATTTNTSAAGTITQAANTSITVGVSTRTTLDATGDITLNASSNDFVVLQVNNGQVVSITDTDAVNLLASSTDNDFTLTAGGDIYLSGNVTTNTNLANTAADVVFAGDVRLAASTVTIDTSASSGAVSFSGTIDNNGSAEPRNNLAILTQDGNVTVSGEIGTTTNIGSLVINKNITNSASVVSLNRVSTREVSAAPATAGIDITASTIYLNGNLQTNRGNAGYARDIILNGNVVLNNDVTFNTSAATGDGAITVTGMIDSDATARSLTVRSDTGTVSLQSAAGGTRALDFLSINSGSQTAVVNLAAVTTNGGSSDIRVDGTTITLAGNLTAAAAGDIRLDGSVVLNGNVTINSNGDGSNGDIVINGDINGATTTNTAVLSISSAASNLDLQNIGNSERIQQLSLTTTSGNINVGSILTRDNLVGANNSGINITSTFGAIVLNGADLNTTVIGASGDDTGRVSINGAALLTTDVTIASADTNGNSNDVTLTGSINADNANNNRNLVIDAGISNVDISANIGASDAVNGLQVRAGNVKLADVTTRSGGIDIVTDSSVVAGNINLTGILDTKDANDAGRINLVTQGSLGTIDLNIATNDAVFNTNSGGGADANIVLDANILNNNAKNLIIDAGNADVSVPRNAGIGLTRLASFSVNAQNAMIGSVNSDGAITVTAANTGTISLGGTLYANSGDITLNNAPVVLTGNAGLNINTAATNNITVDGTINADNATNNRTLAVSMGSGTASFANAIGNNQALQSLSITTAAGGTVNLPAVTTQSGGVTVSSSQLNVNGDIDTTATANAGSISLSAQRVDLANNTILNTNASLADGSISILDPGSGVGVYAQGSDFILNAGAGNIILQQRVIDTVQFNVQSSGTTVLNGVSADSNGGTITVNASNGLTLNGNYSGITNTNEVMSFNADSDANGSGTLVLGDTSSFTNTNGPIRFTGAALSTPGTFSINAGGGANTVYFAATGDMSVGTNTLGMILNNTQLGYITASDINLAAANDLYLSDVSQAAGLAYNVSAGNDIITSGTTYSYFSSLVANATNNITFNRGIIAENDLALTGLNLNVQAYTYLRSNTGDLTVGGNISSAPNQQLSLYAPNGTASIASGSTVSNIGYFRMFADTIQLNSVDISAGNIYLYQTNATNAFNISSNLTSAGYNYVYANSDLNFASGTSVTANSYMSLISFNGDVRLSRIVNNGGYSTTIQATKGKIIDNNGNAVNIVSDAAVSMYADAGVGSGDALEFAMNGPGAYLSVSNETSGNIEISNVGNIRLQNIVNNSNTGNFDFANDGDVVFNKVSISRANNALAKFNITNGDIIPVPGVSGAHLTAYQAIFNMNNTGSVGQLGNPLITDVPYTIEVTGSLGTYIEYLGGIPPKDFIGDNDYKNRALQVIESLSSKQLIEVESLAAIDPAIFTDVRNYAQSDVALMMPADQRYTDDDEDDDEEAKLKRQKFIDSVN